MNTFELWVVGLLVINIGFLWMIFYTLFKTIPHWHDLQRNHEELRDMLDDKLFSIRGILGDMKSNTYKGYDKDL